MIAYIWRGCGCSDCAAEMSFRPNLLVSNAELNRNAAKGFLRAVEECAG
ncbi:MAG: hypothetical protein JWO65_2618 [Sphingomonas bacterium]|nr:hypothetical protein [Sphingomonas bacterium]